MKIPFIGGKEKEKNNQNNNQSNNQSNEIDGTNSNNQLNIPIPKPTEKKEQFQDVSQPTPTPTSIPQPEIKREIKKVQNQIQKPEMNQNQNSIPNQTPNQISKEGGEEKETNSNGEKNQTNEKETKNENIKQGLKFRIDLTPKLIELPELEEQEKIKIRYPLMAPYAYAHIYWDDKEGGLIYKIEEPVLDDTEKEILKIIKIGLQEMINISYIKAAKSNRIIEYLETNVQNILLELGTSISEDSYQKLMYYIYRDSVGLNQIEPMLNDYYIEDIECNGHAFPIYIVHRKYGNIKTNVEFKEAEDLVDFVEKLAQKAGKYISYAKPLLDGTLPDGSRVNATYTEDITTRGATFTIRKFTKDPWTPIHLIKFKTATAEVFAYLWLAIEHKFNVMTIGETASGKTTFLNAIAMFIPPTARICSIEDTRELNLKHLNWLPAVTRSGFGMPTLFGKPVGEIGLFDLLRETFRQNPDYVILGETRGEETSVLFQGMASGHPSLATFHADSTASMVRRFETPPISLPSSLVESLNIVCIVSHIKGQRENFRRLKEINEITMTGQKLGEVEFKVPYKFNVSEDKIISSGESHILDLINENEGIDMNKLKQEIQVRAELLNKMAEKNMEDFESFNKIIIDYYKNSQQVLSEFGVAGGGIGTTTEVKKTKNETANK